ncbi:DNA ligase [endosymbiont DhMRE of Dentiscutata heterogama]|uniref:NAD-dependent DNA ligase LigA n=1 Tax=endosymbiont DhMRE of Dentiscutata heterogama TaxID=1609546 RepID=UPI000629D651|nr:NAD-dependent DNA ligase LigA [endosymbiont DhMRE of Dentiscutata heterogama]CFW92901.1 DNA ligase [endosymbiont DhMRE of Dentiscutata heterogama]
MNKKIEVPMSRIKELISLIEKWNYEYYILNQPSVEDAVYDKHWQELRELEAKYNYILPNSPTQKAGQTASPKFRPVARQNPMLSLDSVDDYENLLKFDERVKKILKTDQEIEYICEWKIDGLSVSLVYRNHHLSQISTRGDGVIGEDITFNKELLKNVPFFLKEVANCEVRGEVYMKKEEFLRLNEELKKSGHKLLANPRNAAAGSLRTLIPLQNRNLHFFAYQLFTSNFPTQLSCLQELEKLGFVVSPDYSLFRNIEEVEKFIQQQEKKRESLDFESDGVVVKVNDYKHYEKLGQTSRFPRWAIAYKFPASLAVSKVQNIYVEVSRNGRITYVAEITPVILQGSKISKVTLHNYAFIANLGLNIGDEIVIKKAGDVIPQITKVIKLNGSASWQPPTNCPSCNSNLKWNSTNIYQLCKNKKCPQKVVNYLVHFASKRGLDIKGISTKNIQKLYENNLLNQPADFYHLYQKERQLLKLEGFRKKSVGNMLHSIENSKKRPLANLLTALGIPLLSSVKTQKLTKFYPDLSSLLTAVKNEEWEKFREILGEETQKELKKYLSEPKNLSLLEEMKLIRELPST